MFLLTIISIVENGFELYRIYKYILLENCKNRIFWKTIETKNHIN